MLIGELKEGPDVRIVCKQVFIKHHVITVAVHTIEQRPVKLSVVW